MYNDDFETDPKNEILQFLEFGREEDITDLTLMYKFISKGWQSTFPNVQTLLKNVITFLIR